MAVEYLKQISQTRSCSLFDVIEESTLYEKIFNSEKLNRKWNVCFLFFDEANEQVIRSIYGSS